MKFDILSDVHQDGGWGTYPKTGNNSTLVLAGDLYNGHVGAVKVLHYFAKYYETILYVDGNHEFYGSGAYIPIQDNMKRVRDIILRTKPSNVHYLSEEGPWTGPDGVAFVGVNGWYDFNAPGAPRHEQIDSWLRGNNDSRMVFGRDSGEAHKSFMLDLQNLVNQLRTTYTDDNVKNVVVVTHSLPTHKVLHPRFPVASNGSFLNGHADNDDLNDVMYKVNTWIFGHTHDRWNINHKGIQFISNPRGYLGEETGVEAPLEVVI